MSVYMGRRLQRISREVVRTPSVRVYALQVGAKPQNINRITYHKCIYVYVRVGLSVYIWEGDSRGLLGRLCGHRVSECKLFRMWPNLNTMNIITYPICIFK